MVIPLEKMEVDGTFYVVPSILRQLFSIHGRIENQTVSLIFCLMTKNKASYSEFFYELHRIAADLNITFKPKQSDFERTIFLASKEYFPETHFQSCLFHFGQNIWRQVQKSKLAAKYGRRNAIIWWKYIIGILTFWKIYFLEFCLWNFVFGILS